MKLELVQLQGESLADAQLSLEDGAVATADPDSMEARKPHKKGRLFRKKHHGSGIPAKPKGDDAASIEVPETCVGMWGTWPLPVFVCMVVLPTVFALLICCWMLKGGCKGCMTCRDDTSGDNSGFAILSGPAMLTSQLPPDHPISLARLGTRM